MGNELFAESNTTGVYGLLWVSLEIWLGIALSFLAIILPNWAHQNCVSKTIKASIYCPTLTAFEKMVLSQSIEPL